MRVGGTLCAVVAHEMRYDVAAAAAAAAAAAMCRRRGNVLTSVVFFPAPVGITRDYRVCRLRGSLWKPYVFCVYFVVCVAYVGVDWYCVLIGCAAVRYGRCGCEG